MRHRLIAVGLAAVLLGSASCATESATRDTSSATSTQPSSAQSSDSLSSDGLKIIQRLEEGLDYYAYTTPQDLLSAKPAAYLGVVDEVHEGRSIISTSDRLITRDNSVILRVKIAHEIKPSDGVEKDGYLYVSMPRGVNAIDAEGNILGDDPNPSLDEIRKALPPGLRVMVVSQPHDQNLELSNPSVTIGSDPKVVPQGVTLLAGIHPQMLVFDQGTDDLEAWPGLTFAEYVTQLDR